MTLPTIPAPVSDYDLARLRDLVKLLNQGVDTFDAILQCQFGEEDVYPEDPSLDWKDSDLLDFTPLAEGAQAIVVRRFSSRSQWFIEAAYRD